MPMSWFQQRRYDYRKQISPSVTFNEVHVKQSPRLIEVARCWKQNTAMSGRSHSNNTRLPYLEIGDKA